MNLFQGFSFKKKDHSYSSLDRRKDKRQIKDHAGGNGSKLFPSTTKEPGVDNKGKDPTYFCPLPDQDQTIKDEKQDREMEN